MQKKQLIDYTSCESTTTDCLLGLWFKYIIDIEFEQSCEELPLMYKCQKFAGT